MHFTDEFWVNFWSSFWADLIVGVVIAGLISWVLAKRRKISASVWGTRRQLAPNDFELQLGIRNSGKVNFRENEIYAHVLVNNTLVPSVMVGTPRSAPVTIATKAYTDFVILVPIPCFPDRTTDVFSIRLKSPTIGERDLLFFLSTAYGFFPTNIQLLEDGAVRESSLGVVKLLQSQ